MLLDVPDDDFGGKKSPKPGERNIHNLFLVGILKIPRVTILCLCFEGIGLYGVFHVRSHLTLKINQN